MKIQEIQERIKEVNKNIEEYEEKISKIHSNTDIRFSKEQEELLKTFWELWDLKGQIDILKEWRRSLR